MKILLNQDLPLLDWVSQQRPRLEEKLIQWCNLNSGTLNVEGVNHCGRTIAGTFAERLGVAMERSQPAPWRNQDMTGREQSYPLGLIWRLRKRATAPIQILCVGHIDTPFAADHPFQQCRYQDADTLIGPGVTDMKGGLLVMLTALEALEQSELAEKIGWTVLLTPDEELGSPGSAAVLQREAPRHQLGLVFEPALADGSLAGERKGSGNFTVVIQGRRAHAGRNPEQGRNAIGVMAHLIDKLNALHGSQEGLAINVGVLQGGDSTNQVPERAVLKFGVRVQREQDANWVLNHLVRFKAEVNNMDGFRMALNGGFERPPKHLDLNHQSLYQAVCGCAQALDMPLRWQPTGDCCEGNNLTAAGLPNIDSLGVVGGELLSDHEFIRLPSLTERARLSTLLLLNLARHGLPYSLTSRGEVPA
ncbi:hydrolase [Marinobacterium arenosum]|uniref:hydrolase n=1 Tax=Marinobacterium arenosum TaxID=2862496 RepID=UPI001C953B91|nr:hydrolase [Marinobacterium arenosum]MBY4676475.1 hydrolase [Marinobacterium arenosum]